MPGLFQVGDLVTADLLNSATYRPMCKLHQTVSQTGIATGTDCVLTFTTEDIDPEGWHDNVTNNSRVTPNIAGLYEVTVIGVWVATTGQITSTFASIYKNGAQYSRAGNDKPDAASSQNTGTPTWVDILSMNGTTDYIQGSIQYGGTGPQATNVSGSGQSCLIVRYLGPA